MLSLELPATGSSSSSISTATDSAGSLPSFRILHTDTPAPCPRSLTQCMRVGEGGGRCSNFWNYINPSLSKFEYVTTPTLRQFTFTYRNRRYTNHRRGRKLINCFHPAHGSIETVVPPWRLQSGTDYLDLSRLWNINIVVSSGSKSYKMGGRLITFRRDLLPPSSVYGIISSMKVVAAGNRKLVSCSKLHGILTRATKTLTVQSIVCQNTPKTQKRPFPHDCRFFFWSTPAAVVWKGQFLNLLDVPTFRPPHLGLRLFTGDPLLYHTIKKKAHRTQKVVERV
jgi:hypothetical protein